MSSSVAGRKAQVLVCTTSGGTYHQVQGVKEAQHSPAATNVDDSEQGVDWVQRIQALKDAKLTLTGGRRTGDTNGQEVIKTAFLNDSSLFVQYLEDGTHGYQQQMRCSKFETSAKVEDKIDWSCELEGTGPITTI